MNAVERVLHYVELPDEGSISEKRSTETIPQEWPTNGSVLFQDINFRYRDGLPLVLKNVSFEIKAGEKVSFRLLFNTMNANLTFVWRIDRCRWPHRLRKELPDTSTSAVVVGFSDVEHHV